MVRSRLSGKAELELCPRVNRDPPSGEGAADLVKLPALDPRLSEVGFGSARLDTFWSGVYVAAALNVYHGVDWSRTITRMTFPKSGGMMPVLSYNGLAQPDPLTACSGYTAPGGAALLVMGAPSGVPVSTTLAQEVHCSSNA